MNKQTLSKKLINVKNQSFELYINDFINLLFYYEKKDNTINISNTYHYSVGDYYQFNITNINKIVSQIFENNHELNNNN